MAARAWEKDQYGCLQYDLQLSGLSVNLTSIKIGYLGHFMPDTIAQVANDCEVTKKTISPCLSRLPALLSPAYTEFLILEPPWMGIYRFA